ncbi:DUF7793 family protein [Winogradskyella psychrotolerans]|uniref:DUF7793 family protein n=1 Tax=Winogradskyella psychrotolerans TaxID=1344585 RepID=UPI001C067AC1|nr:STAS/SEC14 domain-containing protein [Winogradskyella psychrotolerans]MBU2930191.1 STAS/SEC14 domain-containing protein [Winogradskyella psychrotolerans]
MKTYKLGFGVITILKANLAEVVIYDGVVMDLKMVEDYHAFLIEKLETPFSLLINKKYSYTYTFEAQKSIVNIEGIKAMAVVTHAYVSKLATDVLINVNRESNWNIKTFKEREEALEWLENHD